MRISKHFITKMKYGKRLVLFSLFAMNLVDQPAPEVEIEQGTLSGIISGDGTILEYIGIPYATVNSSNRFQAPFPAPKWEGTFKAIEESTCLQNDGRLGIIGTEDCLKINVYVPALANKPLPVMVFIHGGAFMHGSGGKIIYGPDYLVKQDIILVTFNYRLDVLGFLCLGIKEAPGNAGLKDQIAALRWVQKNIKAFGGDPDNVTIFGESAGAVSVSMLVANEGTYGLFKRAIVQSGSSLANWAFNIEPVLIASLLAKTLGHDTMNPNKLYEILSIIPPKELIAIKAKRHLGMYFDIYTFHLPCIEKEIPGIERAVSDVPYNLLKKKPKNIISIMYGSNSKEGLIIMPEENVTTIEDKNNKYLFSSDLDVPSETEVADLDKKLKEFYFRNEIIGMKHINNVTDAYTHLYFEIPQILETDILIPNSKAPVYNYYFNYSGGRNFLKKRFGYSEHPGACHADELFYLFNAKLIPFRVNEEDQKIIDWITKMWTNFAKYGDPTPPSATDLPTKWLPSTKEKLKFLHIENELKMGPVPNPEAYQLWRSVYAKYRRKYVNY